MIQDVVARMATASAWTKRMAIVVVGGAAAVASGENYGTDELALVAVMLIIVLWMIDSQYLRRERWFRDMYEAVAKEPPFQRPSFSITPTQEIKDKHGFWRCAFGWSTLWCYGALSLFLFLVWNTLS